MTYELIILGPDRDDREAAVRTAFNARVTDLGLTPGTDTRILTDVTEARLAIRRNGAPVCIWCGSSARDDAAEVTVVEQLLQRGCPVFPVVEDLANFVAEVPSVLRPYNGEIWSNLQEIVGNVLRGLGLTQRQRKAFISYRRTESQGVAFQLFNALQQRRYDVFLDTASIEAGADFQDELHGRLNDVDLVVLLHSPGVLDSDWVYEEIVAAQQRGTEVLHVHWPDVDDTDPTGQRWANLSLSEQFPLLGEEAPVSDFVPANGGNKATLSAAAELTEDCLQRLLPSIEEARIRSVRTRRNQLVREVSARLASSPFQVVHFPAGVGKLTSPHVALIKSGESQPRATLLLADGIPDSRQLHRCYKLFDESDARLLSTRFLFHELGVPDADRDHLTWLNDAGLAMKSLPLAESVHWMLSLQGDQP